MGKIKLSELTPKGAPLSATDLLLISEVTSDGYASKSITGAEIRTSNPYGLFVSLETQTTVVNTPTPMRIANVLLNQDVNIAESSQMVVDQDGIYNVQFSAQIYRTSGGSTQHVDIWFRVNGVDVDNSNTKVTVQNEYYHNPAWNLFVSLRAGDYVEIMWATTSSSIELIHENGNSIHPAIPSVIATINRIN